MKISTLLIGNDVFTQVECQDICSFSVKGVKSEEDVIKIINELKRDSKRFFSKIADISSLEY